MSSGISLLNAASSLARHSSARHTVIARNIANADSPAYKAKDIQDFSLDESTFALRTTRTAHVSVSGTSIKGSRFDEHVLENVPVEPNGNSVSLEDQMIRSSHAQNEHNKAMAIYQKSMDILKMSMGRR